MKPANQNCCTSEQMNCWFSRSAGLRNLWSAGSNQPHYTTVRCTLRGRVRARRTRSLGRRTPSPSMDVTAEHWRAVPAGKTLRRSILWDTPTHLLKGVQKNSHGRWAQTSSWHASDIGSCASKGAIIDHTFCGSGFSTAWEAPGHRRLYLYI